MRRVTSDCPLILIIHQWIFQKPTFSTSQYDFKQTGRRWRCKEQFLIDRSRAVSEVSFEILKTGHDVLACKQIIAKKDDQLSKTRTVLCYFGKYFDCTWLSGDGGFSCQYNVDTKVQTARNVRRHRCNDICPRVRRVFIPLPRAVVTREQKKEFRASTIEHFATKQKYD